MGDYVSSGTFWFTLALVNAGLAEQKQRGRLNWFLLSLLLGPFATLLIVGMDPPALAQPKLSASIKRFRTAKSAKSKND